MVDFSLIREESYCGLEDAKAVSVPYRAVHTLVVQLHMNVCVSGKNYLV